MELDIIYNKDCFETLKEIDDKSIDLVVTDPPYKINYDVWDKGEFPEFTNRWLSECFRVLKDNGSMWSFMGYQQIFDFVPLTNKYGINHLENWVIWARQKGRGSSRHLKSQREDIFHITKTDTFIWNNIKILREVATGFMKDGKPRGWFINENGQRVRWTGLGNIWVYTAPFWNSKEDIKINHSAQKPVVLLERLIRLSSNEGDIILDPFIGSGTTAIACINTNRHYIGSEINRNYYDIAIKRVKLVETGK